MKKRKNNSFDNKRLLNFNDMYDKTTSPKDIINISKKLKSNDIQHLYIFGIPTISDEFLENLKSNNSLKALIIHDTVVEKSFVEALYAFLYDNTTLNKFEVDAPLYGIEYEVDCTYILTQMIKSIYTNEDLPLEFLSFSNCDVYTAFKKYRHVLIDYITNLLKESKYLRRLKLQKIGLNNDDIEKISKNLNANNLEELDISNNLGITDIGGKAIVKALKKNIKNNKLKKIDISNTNISEKIEREIKKLCCI